MRAKRLAMLALLPALLVAAGAEASPLAPHRAVYDLALDNATERSGITGLTGRMVYEFRGSACEGYTVNFRFVTEIQAQDVTRLTDQQTTTFESGDGKTFRFVTKSFVDQNPEKETQGTATLADGKLAVSLEKPEPGTVELGETQFPTKHLEELIAKAKAGETFYETSLFDGSEDADKVMTTTVIIGRPATASAGDPELKAMGDLAGAAFWPVDMAYFDLAGDGADGEELPTYRISFKLYENGMTRDLVMDYGTFSMTGTLVDLATFEAPDTCSQ